MLEAGTKAPDFKLPDQNGKLRKLSEFKGQKVVLYFYPKDMTSGCSKQACSFGELYPHFREKNAILLSDPELVAIKAYDVWKEKTNYGKKYMGIVRSTYLIDEKGKIVKVLGNVKAADNPSDMLKLVAD